MEFNVIERPTEGRNSYRVECRSDQSLFEGIYKVQGRYLVANVNPLTFFKDWPSELPKPLPSSYSRFGIWLTYADFDVLDNGKDMSGNATNVSEWLARRIFAASPCYFVLNVPKTDFSSLSCSYFGSGYGWV